MAENISHAETDSDRDLYEQAQRWRKAATKLTTASDNSSSALPSQREFARVMQEALGTLLLTGGGDDLRSLENLASKKA